MVFSTDLVVWFK